MRTAETTTRATIAGSERHAYLHEGRIIALRYTACLSAKTQMKKYSHTTTNNRERKHSRRTSEGIASGTHDKKGRNKPVGTTALAKNALSKCEVKSPEEKLPIAWDMSQCNAENVLWYFAHFVSCVPSLAATNYGIAAKRAVLGQRNLIIVASERLFVRSIHRILG